MHVEVDQPGQHVHTFHVDLSGGPTGAAFRVDGQVRRTDVFDSHDAVAFDDDIHRSPGRGAGPVDDGGAAEDESFERSRAFIRSAIRGRQDDLRRVLTTGGGVLGQGRPGGKKNQQAKREQESGEGAGRFHGRVRLVRG